jgi:hypothetical protein
MVIGVKLRILVTFAAVALGGATAAHAGGSLSTMTLQLSDLPTGFTQSKSYACPASCVKKEQGWIAAGYVVGWERDYDGGLKQISSIISSYTSASAAHASMLRSWASAAHAGCQRASLTEKIGDEARLYLCKRSGVSVYAVSWRSGKLKATVLVAGYVVGGDEAATLALKQQARMR